MINTNPNEPLQFGRVIYVEPNNNIVGTGKGTNFTFNPEDYSILVDLQVDVVDRYAYNGGNGKEAIQYTLEWDAKGTKTSLFKGTNGMLTTKALDTSFDDISKNLNQEAIGINSIDIRYNSWNYPEITINFTDIRGASLLATADLVHSDVLPDEKKIMYEDNFANTFFSTFFRFPYPRYTLIVKGFYGRPVTYTLCVNDFKTRFNASTGNFDITVSFIGYMYGLLTDIPMRLLFAAPYDKYRGREYWEKMKADGKFVYNEGGEMLTFFELNEKLKKINENLTQIPAMKKITEEKKSYSDRQSALNDVKGVYDSYKELNSVDSGQVKNRYKELSLNRELNGSEVSGRKYLILFSTATDFAQCSKCNGTGQIVTGWTTPTYGTMNQGLPLYGKCPDCDGTGNARKKDNELDGVVVGAGRDTKTELYRKIEEFNLQSENASYKLPYIPRIDSSDNAIKDLVGTIAYRIPKNAFGQDKKNQILAYTNPPKSSTAFMDVAEGDFEKIVEYLKSSDVLAFVNSMDKSSSVAVAILRVDEFENRINSLLSTCENELEVIDKKAEKVQESVYENILGFKVTLKNIIKMCLAHLDTFMELMYKCMDEIKDAKRLFSDANLKKYETDVKATTEGENRKSGDALYLPPFFAYKKLNPENGELEDAWIGDEPKFANNTDKFKEIQLIDGILNGLLTAQEEAGEIAKSVIATETTSNITNKVGVDYTPTFVSDYYANVNPYKSAYDDIEALIATFAFRCMIGVVYGLDYPNIGNRFTSTNSNKKRGYFEQLARNDAENFIMNKNEFDAFRNSSLPEAFSGITWDDFSSYITGKSSKLQQNPKANKYSVGDMNSPLFTKVGSDDFILSYGKKSEDGEYYVLPLMYNSVDDAIGVANSIYKKTKEDPDTITPEKKGIGISRKFAMPLVEVVGNDDELADRQSIETAYSELCNGTNAENIRNIGWYFRTSDNWKEYFSGVAPLEGDYLWFPSIFKLGDIKESIDVSLVDNKSKVNGNLYSGQATDDGKVIYSFAPVSKVTSMKDFFVAEDIWKHIGNVLSWFIGKSKKFDETSVKSAKANDKYIEEKVVPEMMSDKNGVTLIGLPCGEGTLFESEFYLMQNEDVKDDVINKINRNTGRGYTKEAIKTFRKAFLLLHSLPTSEYGALGRVLETFLKRTYTPAITDIPLSSALFIGALYWREFINGGSNEQDMLLSYSADGVGAEKYKPASVNNLVTIDYATYKFDSEAITRPLNPLKTSETASYLKIVDASLESKLDELERNNTRNGDNELKTFLEANGRRSSRFIGFWSVRPEVKKQFIDLFENWVFTGFGDIEKELSLRDVNGVEFTIPAVADIKKIISDKVFDENGRADKKFNGNCYHIVKNNSTDAYNTFVKNTFSKSFFNNHMRFGASNKDNSLFTFLRHESEAVKRLNLLLTSGCIVKVPFPRVLMTRDMFSSAWTEERTSMKVDDDILKKGWETFQKSIMDAVSQHNVDEEQKDEIVNNITPADVSPGTKLSMYETLKNIHDKWLISTNRNKYKLVPEQGDTNSGIAENFFFINSFYEDVGDEITLNIEKLPDQVDFVLNNVNASNSLYSFMYDIANQARVQLLALPVFNNLSDPGYVREMFSPIPYDEIDSTKVYTESQYVFFYPEEASKHAVIESDSDNEEDRYKFADDSFTLVTEAGSQNTVGVPNTFNNTEGRRVPVFGVTFAKQNQSFFKNINVSMDSPKTTEVSAYNTVAIANKYNGGNTQVTALGQDLFPIYSNYSYECSVEMMGCACIMPLMYFQLNNIPMFKGTYIVYNVSHSITPGNMTTSFSGQRLSRYRKMRNDDALAVAPNENGLASKMKRTEQQKDSEIRDCYTQSGYRLENEYVYDNISRISGINDKAVLRAVEYAETHYTGGFFNDGKVKMYYDPWMAYNNGVDGAGLYVNDQFSTDYVVPNDYNGNADKVAMASEVLSGDTETAMMCTVVGAFGVPTSCYDACGANSAEEFIERSKESFTAQGNYFATLLKNNTELKNALQNKDWGRFAVLYKGQSGVTETGVYSPGDSDTFNKYAADLRAGYNEASGASSEYYEAYLANNPTSLMNIVDPNPPGNLTLDVDAAIKHLVSHSKSESQHSCAKFVKEALAAGGIPYKSCNASDCKEEDFIKKDCYELYTSRPGDYGSGGNKMNPNWQPGDIVIIDNVGTHKYGHIAMWTGTQWISDFRQRNCDIYSNSEGISNGKNMWDNGHFHFYRFKNIKNA